MVRFSEDCYEIFAGEDFYLRDIFNRKEHREKYGWMFDNRQRPISILDKTMCGNGGTTGFIEYVVNSCKGKKGKGCLILVPNVSIVQSKMVDDPNICCVYGGVKDFNIDAQVVIATYDQYPKLMKKLKTAGIRAGKEMEFWTGRTIIVDEYHKLITECGFREVCAGITDLICNVDSPVILMSATPYEEYVEMIRELLPHREISRYKVRYPILPMNKSELNVLEVKKKQILDILKAVRDNDNNKHICVFYNSVSDIKDLVVNLGDMCEVMCADNDKNKDKVKDYFSRKFNEGKRIHFMTSAYFTGHDINVDVDKVIIVGSPETDFMSLDMRDIKQILGRFRIMGKDKGNVRRYENYILYIKKNTDADSYNQVKTSLDEVTMNLNVDGYDWKTMFGGRQLRMNQINLTDTLVRFDIWKSPKSLVAALNDYGFDAVYLPDATKTLLKQNKDSHLTLKEAKKRLINGLPVCMEAYPDVNELLMYKEAMGDYALSKATKVHIDNWYKVHIQTLGVETVGMSKDELCDVFDLQAYRIYNARYLKACVDYFETCSYDDLCDKLEEYFGVRAVSMEWFNTQKYRSRYVILRNKDFAQNARFKMSDIIYSKGNLKPWILCKISHTINDGEMKNIKLSYETENWENGQHLARTAKMSDIYLCGDIKSLSGIKEYDWLMENKEERLPELKKMTKKKMTRTGEVEVRVFDELKRKSQTKASEMYQDTETQYLHKKDYMDKIDCLVLDLDDGMKFSEFSETYSKWTWYAMPSISNIDDDWKKFRVIVPLKHTVELGFGGNNLKILKCLRKMFCRYEDSQHQMYFYMNLEDFKKLRGNTGELYEITQYTVDDLNMYLDNCYDFLQTKYDSRVVDEKLGTISFVKSKWSLQKAKDYIIEHDKDNERHTAGFVVKNNIDPDLRDEMRNWLMSMYGSEYIRKHWDGNSIK